MNEKNEYRFNNYNNGINFVYKYIKKEKFQKTKMKAIKIVITNNKNFRFCVQMLNGLFKNEEKWLFNKAF